MNTSSTTPSPLRTFFIQAFVALGIWYLAWISSYRFMGKEATVTLVLQLALFPLILFIAFRGFKLITSAMRRPNG